MISDLLFVAGACVLATALRNYGHPVMFRLGTFGLVVTSFLAGWLLGGSVSLGIVFASTWFLMPWVEILTSVRKMRLPLKRSLEKCPPPPHSRFPGFEELSDEMESAGFEYVEDVDWKHDGARHFYRLFHNSKKRTTGAICLVEQDQYSFFYSTFSSRAIDGRHFLTWNYPFSQTMHFLPGTQLNRVENDFDIEELEASHQTFLSTLELQVDDFAELPSESLREQTERDLHELLEHNIARGILTRDGAEMTRYSVRGMFFLWTQFLREFVRFS
jgi:hypothetical protein